MSTVDVGRHLRAGDTIVAAQVLGEPTELMDLLFGQVGHLEGLRLFVGMSLTDVVERVPDTVQLITTVGMPPNAGLIASGRMQLVPSHMSHLPWLLTEGPLATDVALIRVSPPDADGWCSLGVISDYIWSALHHARVVLAEIDEGVPVVAGHTMVHLDTITASIRTSRTPPDHPTQQPGELDLRIGQQAAAFVRDRTCLQVGFGRLGEAVLQSVTDRRDLGIHAGTLGDTTLELMAAGVVTGAAKGVDTGLAVAGSVLGTARAVALAGRTPDLRLMSVGHTHDPGRIESLHDYVCIQSALEVDLLGQLNTEVAGGRYVGATGGSVDFLRCSVRAPGGRSIVAIPSATPKGRPRIVPRVQRVSALACDVDVVVTEHGTAELRGLSTTERAGRLIALAHPEHREELTRAAHEAGL